jgi:small GTP-binding protein
MTARKIVLLGEIGVGKSSIARRLVFDRFEGGYKPTIGVDVYSYDIERSSGAPEESVKFVIWDTDGNLGETILSHVYVKEGAAALVVGDVTRRSTLQREAMPGRYCAFLINKSDLENAATELPQELVKSPIPMLRTSAKTGENVKDAFLKAADAIRRRGI